MDRNESDQESDRSAIGDDVPDPIQRAEAGPLEDKCTQDVQLALRLVDGEEGQPRWNGESIGMLASGVRANEIGQTSGDAPQTCKPPLGLDAFNADGAPARSCT